MKLRQTTLLMIGVTLTGLIGGLYLVSAQILSKSLTAAENQGVEQTVKGVLNVFTQTEEDFSDRFADWAAWDDTYAFVEEVNPEYIESNLVPGALANLRVNLVIFIDDSGEIVFSRGLNLVNDSADSIPAALKKHLTPSDRLLQHPHPGSQVSGIVMLPEGPILITARPILTSERQGPIRGTVIFGRYLDEATVQRLSRITRLPLTLSGYRDSQLPEDFRVARDRLTKPGQVFVQTLSETAIAGYTLLPDLYGEPGLLLRVEMPREIYLRGQRNQRYLILAILFVGLVFGTVTLLLLERLVLARLSRLSREVRTIGNENDPSLRVWVSGNDELSDLAETINRMLANLQQSLTALQEEREKSERLLLNILPEPIADRLKQDEMTIADHFTEVTVLFADLVDFTQLSTRISPKELVSLLNQIFSMFDQLAEKHGLEKIKTIGDAYMVVGGLPTPRQDHAEAVAQMALDIQNAIQQFNLRHSEAISIRIGINTGPVVAGVIGTKKFIYDLWGDTVNIASRMEACGLSGSIQVTATTYEQLREKYQFRARGLVQVKGKGEMETYILEGQSTNPVLTPLAS